MFCCWVGGFHLYWCRLSLMRTCTDWIGWILVKNWYDLNDTSSKAFTPRCKSCQYSIGTAYRIVKRHQNWILWTLDKPFFFQRIIKSLNRLQLMAFESHKCDNYKIFTLFDGLSPIVWTHFVWVIDFARQSGSCELDDIEKKTKRKLKAWIKWKRKQRWIITRSVHLSVTISHAVTINLCAVSLEWNNRK